MPSLSSTRRDIQFINLTIEQDRYRESADTQSLDIGIGTEKVQLVHL